MPPQLDRSPPLPQKRQIQQVRELAAEFIASNCDARRTEIIRMDLVDVSRGIWEVDVNASVPNTTIRDLGLPVSKEVLDTKTYTLKINGEYNIVGFSLKSLVED
jgi:hypothetical protein